MTVDYDLMIAELERDEAVRLLVYDDHNGDLIGPGSHVIGHPTIGIGRALDLNGISAHEARMMAVSDIGDYIVQLSRLSWFLSLDPVRQRVIVNMRHNLGMRGLLGFTNMIKAIAIGDMITASQEGLHSAWARQLPARAGRLMDTLRTGNADPPVTV